MTYNMALNKHVSVSKKDNSYHWQVKEKFALGKHCDLEQIFNHAGQKYNRCAEPEVET